MIHIVLIQIILMSWCFYFQFTRALQARKKLIYVEVRTSTERIARILSKQNLNTVIETTLRKKNNNKLFDKFWYQRREDKFRQQAYDGLFVDSLGNVAQGIPQALLRTAERELAINKKPVAKEIEDIDNQQINQQIKQKEKQKSYEAPYVQSERIRKSNVADNELTASSKGIHLAKKESLDKKQKMKHKRQDEFNERTTGSNDKADATTSKSKSAHKSDSSGTGSTAVKKDTHVEKKKRPGRGRQSQGADSVVSFKPGSRRTSNASNKLEDSKHIQVELKGQQTLKFISSDALKEKVVQ